MWLGLNSWGGWVATWKNPPRRNLKFALSGVVLPRKITKLEPEEDLNSRESSCLLVSTTEEWGFVLREIVKI